MIPELLAPPSEPKTGDETATCRAGQQRETESGEHEAEAGGHGGRTDRRGTRVPGTQQQRAPWPIKRRGRRAPGRGGFDLGMEKGGAAGGRFIEGEKVSS